MSSNLHVYKSPINDVVRLFNVPIHALTLTQVLDKIETVIKSQGRLKIGVVNVAKIVNMQKDAALAEDVTSSDIILADGTAVVWASKIMGLPLPERVAGIDLMYGLFDRGCRVFCLGASEDISQRVEKKLAEDYPQVTLAGRRNGYFAEEDEQSIAEQIRDAKPDVLLVAISSPKKERFMAQWGDTMAVPIVHGVGGSFDVFAGKVKRAPLSWQQYGLEWLYRLGQEPRRMWKRYLVTNTRFIWMLLKQLTQQKTQALFKKKHKTDI